jgi:enoyl-CoA hydratase
MESPSKKILDLGVVVCEIENHIALVSLNRPSSKNALNPELVVKLVNLWKQLRDDPNVSVIIVTGKGDCFCSGADLVELIGVTNRSKSPKNEYEQLVYDDGSYVGRALLRDFDPQKPVIAAINGHAIAGGMEIVQGCDIRVASTQALFGLQEPKFGLFPMGGSTVRLPYQVPYAVAMEILLTGKLFSAQRLFEVGFLNYVVPPNQVLAKSLELAKYIVDNSPFAIQSIRKSVKACLGIPESDGMVKEYEIGIQVFAGKDVQEGLRAFKEKRKPDYWKTSKL